MTAFQAYARFYDLLYGDKDYSTETAFLTNRLRHHAPQADDLLEVGCGSGRHALGLAESGFRVSGIDLSPEMIALARNRAAAGPVALRERMEFSQDDIRSANLGRTFPAVISLFHVVSYLATTLDLHAGFAGVRKHLDRDGVFIFDFWHGPAILSEGPQQREKTVYVDGWHILRRTEPVWEKDRDIVRVNFHITATDTVAGEVHEVHEEHVMRYFFPDSLAAVLAEHGLAEVERGEWPTGAPSRADTFGVYMVARAV